MEGHIQFHEVPYVFVDSTYQSPYHSMVYDPQRQWLATPQIDQLEVRTVIHGDKYDDLIKIVWQREFNRLFAQVPDQSIGKWNFYQVSALDGMQRNRGHCYQIRDWAKVRFNCEKCGNGWTSMRGMILFDVEIIFVHQVDGVSQLHFGL